MAVLLTALVSLVAAISLVNASLDGRWNATDLQLQNADLSPNYVTFYFRDKLGIPDTTFGDVLAGQQSKDYSPTVAISGTVQVTNTGDVLGVVTHGDSMGSAEWPLIDDAQLGSVAYVPQFDVALFMGETARLTIHNLETSIASITILFYDARGVLTDTYSTTLPALNAIFLDPTMLGLPSIFHASAVVQSNRKIYVGVDRLNTSNGTLGAAQAPARGGYQLVAPLFMRAYGGFNSIFVVQNAGSITATVVLRHDNQVGMPLSTTVAFLAPRAAFNWVGTTVPTPTYGSIVATANQPIVALVLNDHNATPVGRADYTAIVITPQVPDGLDRHVAYGPVVFTGYIGWGSEVFVANPNPIGTNVLLRVSSTPTGTVSGASASIPPFGVWFYSTAGLPPAYRRAAVTVSATQVIAAAVLSGNPQMSSGDAATAYEAQYAPSVIEWDMYLPMILKQN